MRTIEITIPILNEEGTLWTQVVMLVEYIHKNLPDLGQINLILADNGSSDNTQKIGEALCSQFTSVRYIRLEKKGVGLALKASWAGSSGDIIGYMDLDFATDLSYLRTAISTLQDKKFKFVTGSRLLSDSQVIGRSILRSFTSKVFNLILRSVFRVSFSDGMCGFKFLDRTILETLIEGGAQSDGWFFATELLVVADNKKIPILDLPIIWTDDPNSKVKIVKLSLSYLLGIWSLKKN